MLSNFSDHIFPQHPPVDWWQCAAVPLLSPNQGFAPAQSACKPSSSVERRAAKHCAGANLGQIPVADGRRTAVHKAYFQPKRPAWRWLSVSYALSRREQALAGNRHLLPIPISCLKPNRQAFTFDFSAVGFLQVANEDISRPNRHQVKATRCRTRRTSQKKMGRLYAEVLDGGRSRDASRERRWRSKRIAAPPCREQRVVGGNLISRVKRIEFWQSRQHR
jgi:hypothetical protein